MSLEWNSGGGGLFCLFGVESGLSTLFHFPLGQRTVNFPYKWTSEVIHNNNMYYL
jgi:hypothetical protein